MQNFVLHPTRRIQPPRDQGCRPSKNHPPGAPADKPNPPPGVGWQACLKYDGGREMPAP